MEARDTLPEFPAANWYAAEDTSPMYSPRVLSLWPCGDTLKSFCVRTAEPTPVTIRVYAQDPIPDPTTVSKYIDFPRIAWCVVDNSDAVIVAIFPTQSDAYDFAEADWSIWPIVVSVESGHIANPAPGDLTYPVPEFLRQQQDVNHVS